MPATRKRKALDTPAEAEKPARSETRLKSKNKSSEAQTESRSEIVGGLNGDYRITGAEDSQNGSSSYKTFTIPAENDKVIPCQLHGRDPTSPSTNKTMLIFTHGAGGGIENPATKLFAEGYATADMPIICFQGTMNLQNRTKLFARVLNYCKDQYPAYHFAVGGRSMGARAAVMLAADHEEVKKIVAVSYPLVSPKGEIRDKILVDLQHDKTVFFVTGEKDSMCDSKQLDEVRRKMAASSNVLLARNADHGMSIIGKVQDKEKEVTEMRQTGGRIAAEWVRGKDWSDNETLTLNYVAGQEQAATGEKSRPQRKDRGKKEISEQAKNDEHSDQNKVGTPASNKRKRRSDVDHEAQNANKASRKRRGSSQKKGKDEGADGETDKSTRRRSRKKA